MLQFARRLFAALILTAVVLTQSGCAGAVQSWIVRTRDNQGDRALRQGNLKEAALAYRLALQIDPSDPHSRTGAVSVQLALAELAYRNGRLEDAVNELSLAAKIDPQNSNVVDLRQQLSEARLKRQIVLSNYPTYAATGLEITRSYTQLRALDQEIITNLKRFGYSYDTIYISKAIDTSYQLAAEVSRNTTRLIQFRQALESGVGTGSQGSALAPPASLLPLP